MHIIYEWLELETDSDSFIDENLVNGLTTKFNLSRSEANNWIQKFWSIKDDKTGEYLYNDRQQKIIKYDPDIHELIDWSYTLRPNNKSMLKCKWCKKDLPETEKLYCNEICRQQYINNIIAGFWKEDVVSEVKEKGIDVVVFEAKAAFKKSVRDAEPDELRNRIKILTEICWEATKIAYSILDRDRMKAELDAELSLKGISKKDAAIRTKEAIESAEKQREIDKIKKTGERISRSGECLVCETPTLKEFCSDNCKQSYKTYLGLKKTLGDEKEAWRLTKEMVKHLQKPKSESETVQ